MFHLRLKMSRASMVDPGPMLVPFPSMLFSYNCSPNFAPKKFRDKMGQT